MKYLKISNNGLLDIRLLPLMGGTTKANDSFKIGQWGSGLKYSMAYLLRNNISFKIFIGEEEVNITTKEEVIRDETFEIIYVNDEKTSVTTNMGGDAWKPWMIVRELWCNALDEGGEKKEITTDVKGQQGKTTFYIQLTQEFKEVFDDWRKYFIHDLRVLNEKGVYKIYDNFGGGNIYKQGVLIKDIGKPTVFKYDIKNADLNELREFKGAESLAIVNCLEDIPVNLCRQFFEEVTDEHYEANMSWDWWSTFSNNWVECLDGKKLIHTGIIAAWLLSGKGMYNIEDTICVPQKIYKFFVKTFPEMGVSKVSNFGEFVECESYDLERKVNDVIKNLIDVGYIMVPGVTLKFGNFDSKSTIAKADIENKIIMLGDQLSSKTEHYIASTIIEENEHIRTGLSDETRAFQQHFIDLYTKSLFENKGVKL